MNIIFQQYYFWVIIIDKKLDLKKLKFIGSGYQGRVYMLPPDKCIKLFKNKNVCFDEIETLCMAQGNHHFPKLYEFGENYIIREFISGVELSEYLKKNPLTLDICAKLLGVLDAMKSVGYSRVDSALFHIFITENGDFRLIDTARAMITSSTYPKILISELKDVHCHKDFLSYVRDNRPELYELWKPFIKN